MASSADEIEFLQSYYAEWIFYFADDSECGRVHLTVSSLEDTYLELNWITNCGSLGDVIPEYILLSSKNVRERYVSTRIFPSRFPYTWYIFLKGTIQKENIILLSQHQSTKKWSNQQSLYFQEDSNILLRVRFLDHPSGYYKSRIRFGQPWLPGNWEYSENLTRADPGPHCFPYWISSIKGDVVVDSRCLAIQPTWMSDNRYRTKVFIDGN